MADETKTTKDVARNNTPVYCKELGCAARRKARSLASQTSDLQRRSVPKSAAENWGSYCLPHPKPQTGAYTYDSLSFTSQEAADLFAKSRATKPPENMPISRPAQKTSDRMRLFTGIVVFFALVMVVMLLTPKSENRSGHQAISSTR